MRFAVAFLLALALAVVALALPLLPTDPPKVAPGHGDLVWTSGTYAVRLTDQPCLFPQFAEYLEEQGIPPARASVATQTGRPDVAGCWAFDIAGDVITLDPTTPPEAIPVSIKWFKRMPRV